MSICLLQNLQEEGIPFDRLTRTLQASPSTGAVLHREPASSPLLEEGYTQTFLALSSVAFAIDAGYPRHLVSLEHGQVTTENPWEAIQSSMDGIQIHSRDTIDRMPALLHRLASQVPEAVFQQL
jgi:hypothetical protein